MLVGGDSQGAVAEMEKWWGSLVADLERKKI